MKKEESVKNIISVAKKWWHRKSVFFVFVPFVSTISISKELQCAARVYPFVARG